MRVLVSAFGSYGDVLPFVAVGEELANRGHDVRLYASRNFAAFARGRGIRFCPLGEDGEYDAALRAIDLRGPMRAWRRLTPYLARYLRLSYAAMRADVVCGKTLIVGSTAAFAVGSLKATVAAPTVIVHLSPAALRSEFDAPRLMAGFPGRAAPRIVKRAAFNIVDRLFLEPVVGAILAEHRRALGLAPYPGVFETYVHDADLVIGLFPKWFAAPEPDWPSRLVLTDFPYADVAVGLAEDPVLDAFLTSGPPPIGFTAGTQAAMAGAFFRKAVDACRRLGARGLLLTRHAAQVPARLPDDVAHVGYASFRQLLPRLAALVHHGGIGSAAEALRAGCPQIVCPSALDQFENSRRLRQLGVAMEVLPHRLSGSTLARSLDQLAQSASVEASCARWRGEVRGDGIRDACDAICRQMAGSLS